MTKINYLWVKGLDPKAKEAMELAVSNNMFINTRVLKILKDMYEDIEDKEMSPEEYSKPEVSHTLAFRAGEKRTLMRLYDLFKTIEEE
jgi:hypothetical protein